MDGNPTHPWTDQLMVLERRVQLVEARLSLEAQDRTRAHWWFGLVLLLETCAMLGVGAALLWVLAVA